MGDWPVYLHQSHVQRENETAGDTTIATECHVTKQKKQIMLTVNAKPWSVLSIYNITYIISELESLDQKLFHFLYYLKRACLWLYLEYTDFESTFEMVLFNFDLTLLKAPLIFIYC